MTFCFLMCSLHPDSRSRASAALLPRRQQLHSSCEMTYCFLLLSPNLYAPALYLDPSLGDKGDRQGKNAVFYLQYPL